MENINQEENQSIAPVTDESVMESPVVEEAPTNVEEPVEEQPAAPVVEDVKEEAHPEIVEQELENPSQVQALGLVGDGALGSTTVTQKPRSVKKQTSEKPVEKIAIHSTKNVSWQGIGKVYRGYNIVTKEQADQWLTRSHTRLATPEEVAREFGK